MACSTVLSPAVAALSALDIGRFGRRSGATISSASVWNSLVLGDEVGLAVELDQRAALGGDHDPVGGGPLGPRLPTALAPLIRSASTALSKSPSASASAFLQSSIPAPVSVAELLDVGSGESPYQAFSW